MRALWKLVVVATLTLTGCGSSEADSSGLPAATTTDTAGPTSSAPALTRLPASDCRDLADSAGNVVAGVPPRFNDAGQLDMKQHGWDSVNQAQAAFGNLSGLTLAQQALAGKLRDSLDQFEQSARSQDAEAYRTAYLQMDYDTTALRLSCDV